MLAIRRSITLGLLLVSIGCDGGTTGEAGEAAGETATEPIGMSPAALTWALDWSAGELEFVNDLGYEIHIDAGWIGSWGATLVECSSANAEPTPTTTRSTTIAWPGLVAEGHGSGEDDPSAWVYAGVESLTEPLAVVAEPRALTGNRYCQAHYLLAPIAETNVEFAAAEAGLAAIDPEQSLVGATLVVFGTWAPPGGGEPTAFVLRSEQSYGKILELELAGSALDDADVQVTVERKLASMFVGVEFATTTAEDAAWQVLGNLAKQTLVSAS